MDGYDLAVVGSGLAGYSAALTAKSLKLNTLWLGERGFSDKTARAEFVRNYPAVVGDGAAFVRALEEQRVREGVVLCEKRADGIYPNGKVFLLTVGQETFSARTVILATGVTGKSLNGEREFLGRGVSYCAVCDGALYRGKKVAAVLSSARFISEAEYLASFAETVYCFCLRGECQSSVKNLKFCAGVPLGVEGDTRVRRLITSETNVEVDGVFFLRECAPPSALVSGLLTEGECVVTGRGQTTNIKGLFAAGDVTGRPYQYIKAAGEGCVAAYSAFAFLHAENES